jgi:DNA gyrase subunit A
VEIRGQFGDARRTKIEGNASDIADEDLIADEPMVVTITNTGYIKRIPTAEYRTQKRGGRGLKGMETRDEDFVTDVFTASTKTNLLIFTDKGRLYWSKVYKLPLGSRVGKGRSIANVIRLQNNEKVMAVLPIDSFDSSRFVVMTTEKGVIKKTELSAFENVRQSGIIALTTDLDDRVIDAKISDGNCDIFIATRQGMSIRFKESEVRPMGRAARGVRAITLAENDYVVGIEIINKNEATSILMVTEGGFGKRSPIEEYRVQRRAGVGIITQKTTDRVGLVVGARKASDDHEIIITTNTGQMIRSSVKDISVIGRNTQGVKLITLDKDEKVTGFTLVKLENEE